MTCPNCSSTNITHRNKAERIPDPTLPDVHFIDIVVHCGDCKYSFNCVGAKKIG